MFIRKSFQLVFTLRVEIVNKANLTQTYADASKYLEYKDFRLQDSLLCSV